MSRSQLAVEQSPRAELAGDHRCAGPHERSCPHRCSPVRLASDFSGKCVLAIDPSQRRRIGWTGEAAVHGERLGDRRRNLRQSESDPRDLALSRCQLNGRGAEQADFRFYRYPADRVPGSTACSHKMERLTGECSVHGDYRLISDWRSQSQTHDRPGFRRLWNRAQTNRLCGEGGRANRGQRDSGGEYSFHVVVVQSGGSSRRLVSIA